MAISPPDADAAFFNLMHVYLTGPQKSDAPGSEGPLPEPRESRRAFRVKQWIAPGYCWEVPPPAAWLEVHCCDLAQGGFSYFLDDKPDYERLVAMFRPTDPIFVAARISHCRPVLVDERGNVVDPISGAARHAVAGPALKSMFLVGCQFLRRFTGV